jgi:hypothetical protein
VTEFRTPNNSWEDIELLVRRAGGYVRPSEDLRPRVLEAARLQRIEQQSQSCLRQVAVFIALLTFFTTIYRPEKGLTSVATIEQSVPYDRESGEMPLAASPRAGDGDWRMIDAFTKLRRQQAQLLRFEI